MANARVVKNEIVGKLKRFVGEVVGDQKLHDEGKAQERPSQERRNEPNDIKPFGNLDQLS
jgi:uncharacterized protein YjbJ (UPF0337 family)